MNWFEANLLLALTGSTLIMSLRAITPETNPFAFMTIVTAAASAILFGYCLIKEIPVPFGGKVISLAAAAGISVAVLDLAFIFMFRKGALVSVAIPIFRVSAIMLSAFIGYLLFKEQLTPVKVIGVVLACIAVYLLNTKPTKVIS